MSIDDVNLIVQQIKEANKLCKEDTQVMYSICILIYKNFNKLIC